MGWLDLVTADHLVAKNGGMEGITGDFDALVAKDLYSKVKGPPSDSQQDCRASRPGA